MQQSDCIGYNGKGGYGVKGKTAAESVMRSITAIYNRTIDSSGGESAGRSTPLFKAVTPVVLPPVQHLIRHTDQEIR